MCGGWATHLAVWARVVDSRSGSVLNRHPTEKFRDSIFGPLEEFSGKFFFPVTLLDMVHPNEGVGDEFF